MAGCGHIQKNLHKASAKENLLVRAGGLPTNSKFVRLIHHSTNITFVYETQAIQLNGMFLGKFRLPYPVVENNEG